MKQGKRVKALGAGLLAGGMVLVAPAWAAGYCSAGMATEGIAVGNITFEGASADDCFGVVGGNLTGNAGETVLNGMTWGAGWTYLDATDAPSASFMGIDFVISATPGSTGSFTLIGIDTNGTAPLNLPAAFDFAVGLKGGNEYALWGFDNVMVTGVDNGTFSIVFTNRGGSIPELSHMIVFGREGKGGAISAVPEADTAVMLLAGLGLIGFAARRKLG
jgi:hypothetical protein